MAPPQKLPSLNIFTCLLAFDQPKRLLGGHSSVSLCRVERENKMAATYNVLAFKR